MRSIILEATGFFATIDTADGNVKIASSEISEATLAIMSAHNNRLLFVREAKFFNNASELRALGDAMGVPNYVRQELRELARLQDLDEIIEGLREIQQCGDCSEDAIKNIVVKFSGVVL